MVEFEHLFSFKAFRISKISVYEDRPTAKSIGFLGIALLAGFIAFIVILDCQRLEQCCRKGWHRGSIDVQALTFYAWMKVLKVVLYSTDWILVDWSNASSKCRRKKNQWMEWKEIKKIYCCFWISFSQILHYVKDNNIIRDNYK